MPDRSQRQVQRTDKRGRSHPIEYRGFDLRAAADDGASFDGYASTSWHVDSYLTAFAPGAWTKTLKEQRDRVLVLWQHDPYVPIGRPTAMSEDSVGLKVSAHVTDGTQAGRDAMALLRDEVPLGLSVGFRTISERKATEADPLILEQTSLPGWMKSSNPLDFIYVIEEARLYEFSVVSFPANLHAEIDTVRSNERMQALAQTLEDLRAGHLDDAGRALIAEIVAAWQAAPESTAPPRTNAQAPRDLLSELTVTLAEYGYPLEHVA
jgi:HK97 family phage prohead protease